MLVFEPNSGFGSDASSQYQAAFGPMPEAQCWWMSHARARRCRTSTSNYTPCHCRNLFFSTRNYASCHCRFLFRFRHGITFRAIVEFCVALGSVERWFLRAEDSFEARDSFASKDSILWQTGIPSRELIRFGSRPGATRLLFRLGLLTVWLATPKHAYVAGSRWPAIVSAKRRNFVWL